jgi:transcriptional regulator GlxA family with amidase domain
VLQTQHWLQIHFAENLTGLAMATQAKLGERTLLRRFRRATGLKPKEYVQHLRVGRARETLEFSALSINEISWKVGYEDPEHFEKYFRKVWGSHPESTVDASGLLIDSSYAGSATMTRPGFAECSTNS